MNKNLEKLTRIGSEWGGIHLFLDIINENSIIISCGLASDISLDEYLINEKKCIVVGVDPTKLAYETVKKYGKTSRKNKNNFHLIRKAVHAKSGLNVKLGGPANTFLSPEGEDATTISLEDLVLTYSGASFLKLDIEGAEFVALEYLNVRLRIPQIAIAFHTWFNGKSDQYPNKGVPEALYTSKDVIEICAKIKNMGYKLVYEEHEDNYRLGQETLFIRTDLANDFEDVELKEMDV